MFRFMIASVATAIALQIGSQQLLIAATFTVDNLWETNDVNPGDGHALDGANETSLRAAIEEANALSGRDVIVFDVSLVGERLWLDSQLDITDDLEIVGFTNDPVILDGGTSYQRAIEVAEDVTVEISGIDFENFIPNEDGGAILSHGILSLSDVRFDWIVGSAICSDGDQTGAGADLLLANVTFTSCVGNSGGAVAILDGIGVFESSLFTACAAEVLGGCLYVSPDAEVTIDDCEFESSDTTGWGGAIYLAGGAYLLNDSWIHDNDSTCDGGGVCIYEGGWLYTADSLIEENTVMDTMSGYAGGGVYAGGSFTNYSTVIQDNSPDNVFYP